MPTITPHLWFDKEAHEAAAFYCSIFRNSRIIEERTFDNTPSGTVTSVVFEIEGQRAMILAAGPAPATPSPSPRSPPGAPHPRAAETWKAK